MQPLVRASAQAIDRSGDVSECETGWSQDFEDLQAGARGFQSLAAYIHLPGETVISLTGSGGEPRNLQAAFVSKE